LDEAGNKALAWVVSMAARRVLTTSSPSVESSDHSPGEAGRRAPTWSQ